MAPDQNHKNIREENMKKMIRKKTIGAVALAAAVVLGGFFMAQETHALEERLKRPCMEALQGKCFRGQEVHLFLPGITDSLEAEAWCVDRIQDGSLFCSREECVNRVMVLANLAPSAERGNPCLPSTSSILDPIEK
jgi:hypothetical protein